jgi:4-methylaminobutanoate oxidase (formaldehyde-forming)
LWDTLWEAGQSFAMLAGGYKAIESLRLEKGYRYWCADITPDYTPYEAGLGFAVAMNKNSDFMGRKSLQKQKAEGIKQKLCCIVLEDPDTTVFGSEPVRNKGEVVAWVTSGGYGYSVNKSIAYAYLPIELAKPGTRLSVECFGVEIPASVEKEPLYDPKGEKIKV